MVIVVAAAIVRDDRVLAAQRAYPPELAGQWELPGGKVNPGESETAALQREIREELAAEVHVLERVGPDVPTAGVEGLLRVFRCALQGGEPTAREHQALRWLAHEELEQLGWLDTDRPLVPALKLLLGRS